MKLNTFSFVIANPILENWEDSSYLPNLAAQLFDFLDDDYDGLLDTCSMFMSDGKLVLYIQIFSFRSTCNYIVDFVSSRLTGTEHILSYEFTQQDAQS